MSLLAIYVIHIAGVLECAPTTQQDMVKILCPCSTEKKVAVGPAADGQLFFHRRRPHIDKESGTTSTFSFIVGSKDYRFMGDPEWDTTPDNYCLPLLLNIRANKL